MSQCVSFPGSLPKTPRKREPSINTVYTSPAGAADEPTSSTACVLGWPKTSFAVKRTPSFEPNGLVSSNCERLAFPALLSLFTPEFVSICLREATITPRNREGGKIVPEPRALREASYGTRGIDTTSASER